MNWVQDRGKQDPLTLSRNWGRGRTGEEGNIIARNDSCNCGCETSNCCTLWVQRWFIPFHPVRNLSHQVDKAVLHQILQVIFRSHLQFFLFRLLQLSHFPLAHTLIFFFLHLEHYDPLNILTAKALPSTWAPSQPQGQYFWNAIISSYLHFLLNPSAQWIT